MKKKNCIDIFPRANTVYNSSSVRYRVTWMVPRRMDSRLRHTGSRISMQLKFRQAAGARAHDRACWVGSDGERLGNVTKYLYSGTVLTVSA